MMNKITNALVTLWTTVKSYPHGVALAVQLGVILAARFGLHLTPDELVTVAGLVSVAVTTYTHKAMVSKSLLTGV